ncbi:MAG TPA: hypothetical protein VGG27_15915 [Magnetospirillaceae bacterium]|jgi:hypothetical protein
MTTTPRTRRPIRSTLLTLVLAGTVASCGGGDPYVLSDYRLHQLGKVEVCYDDHMTSIDQARVLADGICQQYSRMASFELAQRDQCNWRTPDIALFYCVAKPGEKPPPLVPQKAPLRGGS